MKSFLEEILDRLKEEGHFETKSMNKEDAGLRISPILDMIEKFDLNFNLGTVVAHILGAKYGKGEEENLQIAAWYLNREIERLAET